jgi:hypothetical protein
LVGDPLPAAAPFDPTANHQSGETTLLFLIAALDIALSFECVDGFHNTEPPTMRGGEVYARITTPEQVDRELRSDLDKL